MVLGYWTIFNVLLKGNGYLEQNPHKFYSKNFIVLPCVIAV